MSAKTPDSLKNKLMVYRILALLVIAYILVWSGIVDDANDANKGVGLYIFALIIALPITMLLDKYIVRFAKKH